MESKQWIPWLLSELDWKLLHRLQQVGARNWVKILQPWLTVKEMIDVVEIVPEKPAVGKAFKKEGKIVMDYLAQMDKDAIKAFEDKLNENG